MEFRHDLEQGGNVDVLVIKQHRLRLFQINAGFLERTDFRANATVYDGVVREGSIRWRREPRAVSLPTVIWIKRISACGP